MGSQESKDNNVVVVPVQQGETNDGYHSINVHKSTLGATVVVVLVILISFGCCYYWCKSLVNKPSIKAARKEIEQLANYP